MLSDKTNDISLIQPQLYIVHIADLQMLDGVNIIPAKAFSSKHRFASAQTHRAASMAVDSGLVY